MKRYGEPVHDVEPDNDGVSEGKELVPLAEVEEMVRNAVEHALAAEYLPSLLLSPSSLPMAISRATKSSLPITSPLLAGKRSDRIRSS
jgi:hypothetical protein